MNRNIKDLLVAAESWSHRDDWNVDVISLHTLDELADALAAGDDPLTLKDHASHVRRDCIKAQCAERIPAFLGIKR